MMLQRHVCVSTDNDFDADESATHKAIISKCLANSIAWLNASKEHRSWPLQGASFDDTHASTIVKALDGNKRLVSLDISNNCFTEAGLTEIAKMMETNSTIALVFLDGACVSVFEEDC